MNIGSKVKFGSYVGTIQSGKIIVSFPKHGTYELDLEQLQEIKPNQTKTEIAVPIGCTKKTCGTCHGKEKVWRSKLGYYCKFFGGALEPKGTGFKRLDKCIERTL